MSFGVMSFGGKALRLTYPILSGATVVAPARLSISGNYTNNGTSTKGAGVNWVQSGAATDTNRWTSVVYGNGIYVAVGYDWNLGVGLVMTSADGIVWTSRTPSENSDWYSVTYGNGLFVATADGNGTNRIMTSSDGIAWTARTAPELNPWDAITYGNGLFVAVSTSGTNRVMTSPDGITWTPHAAAEANPWESITYGNGLFVAVAYTGTNRVMTSPDGITWTARSASVANSWQSVTYGAGLFVAVAWSGTGDRVMTSPDGINWTTRTSATDTSWQSVTYGAGLFVSVSYTGTNSDIMTSADGITWISRMSGTLNKWQGVTYGNGQFIAVSYVGSGNRFITSDSLLDFNGTSAQMATGTMTGSSALGSVALTGVGEKRFYTNASTTDVRIATGTTLIAPDQLSIGGNYTNNGTFNSGAGTNWNARTAAEANQWQSITYGNGLFVAVADSGTNRVQTSPDGITWTPRTAAEVNTWTSITYGNGLFVAVSDTGTNRVMTSPDGITWTARSATEANGWNSITYGNGLFVAVSYSGTNRVQTSPDGTTWTPRSASEANAWVSVTYGNGLFVAVSDSGTNQVMTSSDGTTWTPHAASEANAWYSVTYGNGLFVAVSYSGTNRVMTSPDGTTWTARAASEANSWRSITYGNGLFLAVALSGTNRVMTSPDGTTWTARAASEANSWRSITYGNGLFVAVSYDGTNRVMTSAGTVFLNGTTDQTATGTMTGASSFNKIVVQNGTASTTFAAPVRAGLLTSATQGAVIAFAKNATSTFTEVSLVGTSTNKIKVRSTVGGTQATLAVTGASTFTNVDVKDSYACPSGTLSALSSTNSGNNTCWSFLSAIILSGTLYGDEGVTAIATPVTIAVAISTTTVSTYTTTTSGAGTWSITIPVGHVITASTPILAWVDASTTIRAAVVTKALDGGTDIAGLNLYQNRVIVRNEGATTSTSTTIADMARYDGDNDGDIQYSVDSATTSLTVKTGNELHVWSGDTFAPAGAVAVNANASSTNALDGSLHLTASSTYTAGGNTTLGGSLRASSTALFTPYGYSLLFNASTTGKSVDTPIVAGIGSTTFAGTGTYTFANSATTTHMQINSGAMVIAPAATISTLTVLGDFTQNGTFTNASSTLVFAGMGSIATGTLTGAGALGNVTVAPTTTNMVWTARSASEANGWNSITYGNGLFVAVAQSGTNRVMTSSDGVVWTPRTAVAVNQWYAITYGNGLFVATASGATTTSNAVMTSSDGITWTPRTAAVLNNWISVTYGNGLFVAFASIVASTTANAVMTSPDGITWTPRIAAYYGGYAITYGNGLFVTVGQNEVATSPDGIIWTPRTAAEANAWYSVTYGNGLFVAVSTNGTNRVMTSPDGITWTSRTPPEANAWYSVTYGNGLFVAVACGVSPCTSDSRTVIASVDGITWTARTATEANYWNSVTYGNGLFVAVSYNGTNQVMTMAYSTTTIFKTNASTTNLTVNTGATIVAPEKLSISGNYQNAGTFTQAAGTKWTARSAAEANTWKSVTYGNGLFVAVSSSGTNRVMTSPDGTTWTPRVASEANQWYSVTYGNGLFVAVAVDGTNRVMTSPDGITWTARAATEANLWFSITYGNGLFVAVAQAGTNRVMTSPDGITWTSHSAASANTWKSVTYGNGLFVAVAVDGTNRVMTSPDGITWTARAASEANQWYSITYGNGLFVAVAYSGTNRVMTSPDGITWTARAASEANQWYSITYGNGLFVAVALDGTNRVMTSPDGITWTARVAAEANEWRSITYGNGLFVAVAQSGTNRVMTSAIGTTTFNGTSAQTLSGSNVGASTFGNVELVGAGTKTFTGSASSSNFTVTAGSGIVTAPASLSLTGNYTNNATTVPNGGSQWTSRTASEANSWYSVTYGNGLFVAVSYTGTNRVMTSPDGTTWTARVASEANQWYSVTYGNGLFVAVAVDGTNRVMTSSDGITWTARVATEANSWRSITYGNGLFVAVSQDGTSRVMRSSDGINWATSSAAQANPWNSVTYGNGLFVAVAMSGTNRVMTSPDGITWTPRSAAQANSWQSVTYGNGLFVAMSADGTNQVMTSSDGITWTSRSAVAANNWYSVTYGNGLFVAVSYATTTANAVMTSPDSITWTPRSASEANFWTSITYGNGLFVAISTDGTNRVMTSPATTLLTLNGTTQQTATGTMAGASAFNNLTLANTSMNGSTTQSVVFGAPASTTGTFKMLPGTSAQFAANATSTFQNINLGGDSTTTASSTINRYVWLRSPASSTPWNMVVAGNQELVSYVNVRDSHACSGNPYISAVDGTSVDAGGNTCWQFIAQVPTLSSSANQAFTYNQATTSISTLTVTDAVTTPTITATNDIRIKIATSSTNMRWDTTDTTAVIGGVAAGKVSTTVSYEGGGSVLVLNVTSTFAAGDSFTVSGLSFAQFAGVSVATTTLRIYAGGASDIIADDADDKTISIAGALTLADHASGQVSDSFTSATEPDLELFAFKLTPAGESASLNPVTIALNGINGILTADITNATLYRDMNSNKIHDAGDVAVGGAGAVAINGQSGTITFSTTFQSTTTQNYLVVGDVANLAGGELMTVSFSNTSFTSTGVTTALALVPSGLATSVQHIKGNYGGGGASAQVGGAGPAGQGVTTGGGQGGGNGIGSNGTTTIGDEVGFNAPASNGTPVTQWTTPANAYASDGVYATVATNGFRQGYGTFGFSVPANNTITGIAVKLEASGSTAAGTISVRLSWNGGTSSTTLQTTATLTTTDGVYTLGGPSDTWGHVWTASEFNNGNFTIELIGNTSANTISVDAIQVRVYHQSSGGGGGGGGMIYKPPTQHYASIYSTQMFANVYSAFNSVVSIFTPKSILEVGNVFSSLTRTLFDWVW
jgi:hypothetical protein